MKRFDPGIAFAHQFIQEEIGQLLALKAWYCDSTYRYLETDNLQPLLVTSIHARRPEGNPKADNRRVLQPYSKSMRDLLQNGYTAKQRPSGHAISTKFQKDNGGLLSADEVDAVRKRARRLLQTRRYPPQTGDYHDYPWPMV